MQLYLIYQVYIFKLLDISSNFIPISIALRKVETTKTDFTMNILKQLTMKNILTLLLLGALVACSQKEAQTGFNEDLATIENYLDEMGKNDRLSGTLLIAKGKDVLLHKSYGFAHIGFQIPNSSVTKFNTGSIGKSFTALSILQLVQKGQLSLEDPIGKFFPDYPDQIASKSVTVQHLLTHTSGLPHYFARKAFLEGSKDLFRSSDDLRPLYENEPMESKAGEVFSYRNTNYAILGRIIEQVTKEKYDDYLDKHVFAPAGMINTGNFDMDHPIPNAAEGYTISDVDPSIYKLNIHTYPVKGGAAGGGYTTTTDLHNYVLAIQGHVLLDREYTKKFTSPLAVDNHYGLGMQFSNPDKGTIYGHSGGHFGVGVEWRVYEEGEYIVCFLTNRDTDQGFLEARFFIQATLSGPTPSIERFFNTKEVVDAYRKGGFNAAIALLHPNKPISEFDMIMKGYDYIKKREYARAIDIFKIGILAFPGSSDMFDSLGEAYMENGDTALAIEHYEKSIELNPENQNGVDMLKELRQKPF